MFGGSGGAQLSDIPYFMRPERNFAKFYSYVVSSLKLYSV